ncbi:L,D-transpeptidase [Candidatus Methylacidiphilum infernorum]|nr:L,D-transpeptidase [Candidatus Methylacidiphilum infernorum]
MRPKFLFAIALLAACVSGCTLNNQRTSPSSSALPSNLIRVSIHDQKMELIQDFGKSTESRRFYPVSTSKYGIGDEWNSYKTPIGRFVIAKKIGDGIPLGGKFYHRKFTGDVIKLAAYDPSKSDFNHDSILTRILWLKGLDLQNKNSFNRGIFIHGTNQEGLVGQPVSYGCIRMKNRDVLELYDLVSEYTPVYIQKEPLKKPIPKEVLASFHLHSPFYSSSPRFSSYSLSSDQSSLRALPVSTPAFPPSFRESSSESNPGDSKTQLHPYASSRPPGNSLKEGPAAKTPSHSHLLVAQGSIRSSSKTQHSLTKSPSHKKGKISTHKTIQHSPSAKKIILSSSQPKKKKDLE